MEPLVSIIIPVFNVIQYLAEALDSVIGQSYQNLEILVIDDGSTDGSSDLCDQYQQKDTRIRVFHQENKGVSSARNTGLDHMTGDLVAFLDSDDAYDPDMIRKLVYVLQQYDADIVKCATSNQRTSGKLKKVSQNEEINPDAYKVFSRQEALIAFLYRTINIAMWNKLYRKELWENFRFPELVCSEDLCATLQILNHSQKVVVIPEKLIMYRALRTGSLSSAITKNKFADMCTAFNYFENFIQENTPGIYSDEDYQYFQMRMILEMLEIWENPNQCSSDAMDEIRAKLKERRKDAGVYLLPLKTKIKYRMICYCPQPFCVVKSTFRLFRKIYRFIFKSFVYLWL